MPHTKISTFFETITIQQRIHNNKINTEYDLTVQHNYANKQMRTHAHTHTHTHDSRQRPPANRAHANHHITTYYDHTAAQQITVNPRQ